MYVWECVMRELSIMKDYRIKKRCVDYDDLLV